MAARLPAQASPIRAGATPWPRSLRTGRRPSRRPIRAIPSSVAWYAFRSPITSISTSCPRSSAGPSWTWATTGTPKASPAPRTRSAGLLCRREAGAAVRSSPTITATASLPLCPTPPGAPIRRSPASRPRPASARPSPPPSPARSSCSSTARSTMTARSRSRRA